jgi:hypothetical protein
MNKDTMQRIEQRAQRYWYEDGIWEIGFGFINLLLGIFFLLASRVNWVGPMALVMVGLQLGVFLGAFWLIGRIVRRLKERITYPRTGYVAYRRRPASARARQVVLAAAISASIGGLTAILATLESTENRMPMVTGLFLALGLVVLGRRFSLQRMYIQAALVLLLGFGVSQTPLSEDVSTGAFFTGFGLLMMISGAIALIVYLRRTNPADGEMVDYEPLPDAAAITRFERDTSEENARPKPGD